MPSAASIFRPAGRILSPTPRPLGSREKTITSRSFCAKVSRLLVDVGANVAARHLRRSNLTVGAHTLSSLH